MILDFLTVVFLRIWINFLLDGLDLDFVGFSGYLDIYINQLPIQNYSAGTACTMALLLFFRLMVITAGPVKASYYSNVDQRCSYREIYDRRGSNIL